MWKLRQVSTNFFERISFSHFQAEPWTLRCKGTRGRSRGRSRFGTTSRTGEGRSCSGASRRRGRSYKTWVAIWSWSWGDFGIKITFRRSWFVQFDFTYKSIILIRPHNSRPSLVLWVHLCVPLVLGALILSGDRNFADIQGWAKEWTLGCVNPASWLPLAAGGSSSRNLGTTL